MPAFDAAADPTIGLVANLGYGLPASGQTQKARALLGLLERSGRTVRVVDVGPGRANIVRLIPMVWRGETLVVALNRHGLWVALSMIGLVRRLSRRRSVVIVPVVGGWLPDYLAANRWYRLLARVADEYLAETTSLVDRLRTFGVDASEFVNFRRLPVDETRIRRKAGSPLRLCFSGRVRADKGILLAARLVDRLDTLGVPTRLDVYGPIEDADEFRAASEIAGVSHRGEYATAEEAFAIFSDYDFLVLPTSYVGECMPGAVVEGNFAALPAVVSDWHDLGQVVIDGVTGYVCPLDGFVEVAADRIRVCLQLGELEALSRNALQRAASLYTEDAAAVVFMGRIRANEVARA